MNKLKEMDKVCLLIPHFNSFDGISQLIKRYVHACFITGLKKPTILCTNWEGYIPDGWILGEVKREKGMFEIEVKSINNNILYCWDTKESAIKVFESAKQRARLR